MKALFEVGSWRCPQSLSKHGNESARRTITRLQSRVGHLRAFRQKAHSVHEPELLSPFSKGHSNFLLEESFDGPLARTNHPAELSERSCIARVSYKNVRDADNSPI